MSRVVQLWLTQDTYVVPVAFQGEAQERDRAIAKKIAAGWFPLRDCPTKECDGAPEGCKHMKFMISSRRAGAARKEAALNELERTKATTRRTEDALKALAETLRVQHETAEQIATWLGTHGRTRNQKAVARRLAAAIRAGRWRR